MKIIFTGDLLRNGLTEVYIKHAYNLFSELVKNVCSHEVLCCSKEDKEIFDNEKFLNLCGFNEISEEAWLSLVWGNYTQEALEYFKVCFKDCFLIFQEGGAMKKLADASNIPYVEMFVSSIRFMDDVHFAFRSNVPEITEKLKKYRMNELNISQNALRVKAYYGARNKYAKKYEENSLLLCGQTEVDLALIKDGQIVSFLDYKDELNEIFSHYSKVYYKPHPHAKPNTEKEKYIRSLEKVKLINEPFYNLVSRDEISGVAALSSSVLKEAEYFGKKIHTIFSPYVNYWKGEGDIQKDDYMIITNDYFSNTFWANILSSVAQIKEYQHYKQETYENMLRTILNCWYAYDINRIYDYNKKINFFDKEITNIWGDVNRLKNARRNKIVKFFSLFILSKEGRHKFRKKYMK